MKIELRLYCEQQAVVTVEADPDTPRARLRELALQKLDSGEAHWETIAGWVDSYREIT